MASKSPFLLRSPLLPRFARLAAALALAGSSIVLTAPAQAQDAPPDASSTPTEQADQPAADATAAPTATVAPAATPVPRLTPARLVIQKLGVDATIVPVGEDEDGAMAAPSDPDTVAWWSEGFRLGGPGNVVLAAHVDWGGRLRVFGWLRNLGPGDSVEVFDDQGGDHRFVVEWSKYVDAEGAPVDEIFAGGERSELTLITCGGEFDHATRQYLSRLIVRAVAQD
jgi:sortase (surface protein transpeptidase)